MSNHKNKPIIKVVGLGGGDLEQMPLGVYRLLQECIVKREKIYLRTREHPVVTTLETEGLLTESFDAIYEETEKFEEVYIQIVQQLIDLAQKHDEIVYAVPGHPMVAENVVQQLLMDERVGTIIVGGKSFIDDLLQAVHVDIINGFQLVDALDFSLDDLVLTQAIMIMQIFNAYVASEVKLILLEKYPYDYQVALVHRAGTKTEKVEWLPLYEIDRMAEGAYNLTTLFVPPMSRDTAVASFQTLQYYMDEVGQKDIWLQQQTLSSLTAYLQEETQELIEAIESEDDNHIIEELGDVLWQVLFQTSVAERLGYFTFEEVLSTLNRKIRRRHPHVFDGVKVQSVEELDALWQSIKRKEK